MTDVTRLRAIKLLHTLIWGFLAACVVAIPVQAWRGRYVVALLLTAIVVMEMAILAANAGHCPLTAIAARYTSDRRDNFDIYLPAWLARRTKIIFGPLFLLGLAVAVGSWWMTRT